MRWKTTAVLAVLLIGLGAFFYVYEVRQGPAREQAAAQKDRLWKELEATDIDDIVIKRGTETIHLKKVGEGWTLVAPVEGKAEVRPVEDLRSSLATARVERQIDASPQKLADFALEPPAVEITFNAKGQTRGVRLGGKNPTGIWVYAQEAGKPAVFLVPEGLLRDSQKSASDFRDRAILAFERRDVRGLEVKLASGPTVVAALNKGTEEWQLTSPVTAPADREQIGSLLDRLKAAKIKEFVVEPAKSPDPYGFERPLRLTLWLGEEKERAAKTLRFGKAVPDKKAVYAQREGDQTVFLVEEELWKALPTSAQALRDKTVLAYDRGKLERVELESPKGKVALALAGGAWRVTAPLALKADEGAVGELLSKARDLRAKEFVAEDGKRLAQFGLDQPQVRLTVWEKEASAPKTLLLAPAKGRDGAYAALGSGSPVVLVDGKALADLTRSAQDLRDHSLFEGFDTREVTRVEIKHGSQTLTLERKGEDDWRLVQPRKGKARASRVSDLVWVLRNLKWRDLVAEQGWEPSRYGLEPPATTVTLAGKDGKTIAALAVGKREPTEAFVRLPGQAPLYAVDPRNLGDIPATPEDLLL